MSLRISTDRLSWCLNGVTVGSPTFSLYLLGFSSLLRLFDIGGVGDNVNLSPMVSYVIRYLQQVFIKGAENIYFDKW